VKNMDEKIEVFGEVIPEAYEDGLKPVVQETGKTVALIPRAINAALAPLRQWIAQKEYNVAETEKLLAIKLKNVDIEQIATPEAYVAVPAIQAIAYSMDSKELREMYASLLATSMMKDEKWKVHPSFVEIIKQLTPDEAKLLKRICAEGTTHPLIDIHLEVPEGGYRVEIHNFSTLANNTCEEPDNICAYIDNLARLKLIDIPNGVLIHNNDIYEELESYPEVKRMMEEPLAEGYKRKIERRVFELTQYGKNFAEVCLK
jgi:hypothetical protein